MPKVEEIKVLNIDGVTYAVDSMSDEVKELVGIYNEWNQDLADAQKTFAQLRAATQSLSNQIVTTVRQQKAAEEEAKKAEEAAANDGADAAAPTLTAVPEDAASEDGAPAGE